MSDPTKTPEATLAVISAQLNMMNENIMLNFKNIREDIRRMEDTNRVNMESLEERLNVRINSTNARVKTLEDGEKTTIATQAKHAVGYSFGGGLIVALASEFLKHLK